jgi:FtsH-binding integral membrane protein
MDSLVYRSATAINAAMGRVYLYMFYAVAASFVTAGLVTSTPALMAFFFTGVMKWVTIFAPLVFILVLSFGIEKLNKQQALLALGGFAVVWGVSMAAVFAVYTTASVVSAFMGAGILFAVMSFYGYFTKKDLTSLGQFMFIGLIAIVIASIVNIFIGSSVGAMVISALAIIIFLGLTAYDTQNIRNMVSYDSGDGKNEVLGALSLYMNFINIFLSLLQLFGNKED